ncbi:MAG TPA: hypothetical protein PL110_13455 [Candidatus Eremiobacteraeota bacterium]|nr:MAG: hypothetical protein BWY64_03407 [bacterium ADurb.Bin363]HPZ09110.1 hypothetical protein [Candidatus Eremiobacteraeota bacterium]
MVSKKVFSFTALGIWGCAFGYFICYWPYSSLTKALSKGLLPGMKEGIPSFELLPISAIGAVLGMIFFLTVEGWWKFAGRRKIFGIEILCPNRWTFMSGLCSSLIIATTTLSYTFPGVSIVFVMLLMRGGVLIIAPIVDFLSKRKPKWYSLVGLALSFLSLLVAFSNKGGYNITLACAINVGIYLFSYFVRLRFMSKIAKSDQENANTRYFVEEQLVASPTMLITLIIIAFIDCGQGMHEIRLGFTEFLFSKYALYGLILGLFSSGTGFFGGLILLDKRENTYCVPVNRCSSVLAGVLASYSLMYFFHDKTPETSELIGAGLIVLAILFLTIPTLFGKKSK